MKLSFHGDTEGLVQGLERLRNELGFEFAEDGLKVNVVRHDKVELAVGINDGGIAEIRYAKKVHFFRAVGLLLQKIGELGGSAAPFHIREEPQFTMNGPMFDVSQGNAVMRVETVQTFLRKMALMGLDMIMLYAEDSYEVKEQPYFGYMRGRYSQAEIRELDDYADLFGIEMIPCIQTLSHLKDVLKWEAFAPIRDDEETMLVGEEQTYAFIEQMILAASEPVRTRRIHIGMDEAWKLGLGEYLARNGLRNKSEIMNDHLHRVLDITRKHGLQPMMWSDMYFRAGSRTGDYYDPECVIPQQIIDGMPKDVQFVYWDYYHYDKNFYTDWINRHKAFGSTPIFAGGIWNWKGFVLNYGATFASTNAALDVCKREGVKEVIATLWGDDATECDWYSALLGLQLFAEHGYAKELSEEKLRRRFEFCTGGKYDDYMAIRLVDEIPGIRPGNLETYNPSRYLLWQHVMMGLFDRNIEGLPLGEHFEKLAMEMAHYAERNGEFSGVFEVLHRLCEVLAVKAELGVKLTEAYRQRNHALLREIADQVLPQLQDKVNALRNVHRQRWYAINKPFGWEIIDARYGSLLMSLDTAEERIGDFLEGRTALLEELEEPRLPFNGGEGLVDCYFHKFMPSASRLTQP